MVLVGHQIDYGVSGYPVQAEAVDGSDLIVQGRFDEVVMGTDRPFVAANASPDESLLPFRFSADGRDATAPHARVGFRRFERRWSGLPRRASGLRECHAKSRGGRFDPAR